MSRIVTTLNAEQIAPPQGTAWTNNLVYNLKFRKDWHRSKPVNVHSHTGAANQAVDRTREFTGKNCIICDQGRLLKERF